jgi:polar amino acid transport system substrate-binding protein
MKKNFGLLAAALLGCAAMTGCGGNNTLTVYTESGFAPFEYVDPDTQQIVGVDVDIMNLVGEKLGKNVVFEDVGFDTIVDAVSQGKLTNVGAAGLSITPERQAKVDFSKVYYTANLYVIYDTTDYSITTTMDDGVVGAYWTSLAGTATDNTVIGIQTGTTADFFLSDELDPECDYGGSLVGVATKSDFDKLDLAVQDLINNNLDFVIIDELPAKQLIKNKPNLAAVPLYWEGTGTEEDAPSYDEYAIAVTKGQTELLAAINEVLDELLVVDPVTGISGIQALVNNHLGL